MTNVDPATVAAYGRAELVTATAMIRQHQRWRYGLCRCGRVWECDVNAQWAAYARYWEARLRLLHMELILSAPTMLLEVVR